MTDRANKGTPKATSAIAALTIAAIGLAAASAAIWPGLGYDAWAWMIWAREAGTLGISLAGGPSFKPLPVLVLAPVAHFGDAAPFLWLTTARACLLLSPIVAWQLGRELDGRLAGAFAAAGVGSIGLLMNLAAIGYSESVTIICVLGAALCMVRARGTGALLLLAIAGLTRPEVWPFAIALAAVLAARRALPPARAAALAIIAPTIWLGIGWLATGHVRGAMGHAQKPVSTAASVVLAEAAKSVVWPVLAGLSVAVVLLVRDRDRRIGWLTATGLLWIALIAAMAEDGFSGLARYTSPGVVLLCVVAGWGWAKLIGLIGNGPMRAIAAAAVGIAFIAAAAGPISNTRNQLRWVRDRELVINDLAKTVEVAGGREAITAVGSPIALNGQTQAPLAWRLGLPISSVQVRWPSERPRDFELPAVIFHAPYAKAGKMVPLPTYAKLRTIARYRYWTATLAEPR